MNLKSINIWRIPNLLKEKSKWIILSIILCGVFMFVFSTIFIDAQYTSKISMYIYSNTNRTEAESEEITSLELSASQLLVSTYIVILQSDTVMEQVIERLDLNCSVSSLRSKISATAVNNTEVLSVSVTDTDPERAQQIANTIADVLPAELVRVVKAGGVEVIDYAKVPENPSAPNVRLNVLTGVLFGFLFSSGVIILRDYFNTKVKGEDDLVEEFSIPVLGIIPMLSSEKEK